MNLLEYSKANVPPVGTPDAKGTPFDPRKHSPRVHPKTKCWMPRSPGRFHARQKRLPGVDAAAQPAPAVATPTPDAIPGVIAEEVDVAQILAPTYPTPTVPPEKQAGESADTPPPAPGASFIPSAEPPPAPGEAPTGEAQAPAAPEAIGTPKKDANVVCRALYFVTGLVTGERDEARPSAGEHADLRDTLAGYLESRGIRSAGFWAVAVGVVSYVIEVCSKPKTAAKVRVFFASGDPVKSAKPVPAAEPVTVEIVPTPAPQSAAPAPGISSFGAPPEGGLKF